MNKIILENILEYFKKINAKDNGRYVWSEEVTALITRKVIQYLAGPIE